MQTRSTGKLVHMDNMNNPMLHNSPDFNEMMSKEIQAMHEKLDEFILTQQKQQLQTKPFTPYNHNQRFIPPQQYQQGNLQQQYVQSMPFIPYNQNHGFAHQQQFHGGYLQQPVINAPDLEIKTMLQQILQDQTTYNDIILGSLSEITTRKKQPTITEVSEVQVGEVFCEKSTQGDRLDVLTRPGDRVKPTFAEKPFISRKNETLYVPPPYKPPLPFPGKIKKESMERYKEISVKQLMETEVHTPAYLKSLKEAVIEKNAQAKDEFLLEAEECVKEFKFLLGCTVDENCVIRYEDQVKPVAIMISSTKSNGEVVGVVGPTYEDPCEGVMVVECAVDMHLGITFTYAVSIYEPRKIPFEEIRMKEFRGWFYDEYDPGDTWTLLIRSKQEVKLSDYKQAHLGGSPMSISVHISLF